MANTWGNNYWGINSWGEQDDVTLTVTGSSVSSSIGTSTTQANADVIATSLSLTITLQGAVAGASAEVSPIGLSMSVSTGEEDIGVGADVTGSSITTSITGVTIDETYLIGAGWGRDTFGNLGWGVNYSALGGGVNGLSVATSIGDEDAFTNATVVPEGLELDTAITPVGTSGTSDNEIAHSFLIQTVLEDVFVVGHANVSLTGIGSSVSIGEAEAGLLLEVSVTGVSATLSIGDEDQSGSAVVIPTGVTSTMAIGDSIPESKYAVTGVSASLTAGQTTVVGSAVVIPTGIGLTISTVTPNIIAWAEVNTGTPVNWTVVDLAA